MRRSLLNIFIAGSLLGLPAFGCTTTSEDEDRDQNADESHDDATDDHADDGDEHEVEDADGEHTIDAGKRDAGSDASTRDSGTGAKPDAGTGTKPDASTGTRDAGTSTGDASTGTRDASTGTSDAGSGLDAGPSSDAGTGGGGKLPTVTSVETNGPFETVIEMNVGPNRGWVVRPKELGKDGLKHPIFTWGAGAGTNASNYRDHLTRIASHGFVVEGHASNGNGSDHKGAIDWLVKQNDDAASPYYQKLDTSKIASGGHSQGSISTFAMADDPRLTTTIHVAGGSFDGNGSNKLKKPAAMILGKNDTLATPNGERDYMRSQVPTFLTVMDGVDHIMAARQGLAPIVAWLRWHLGGETERKAQFVGANCEYCQGKFKSQSKGF